ncbi:ras-related protein Rab-4A-like [Pteropus vampyrus]|uniref:Ras-related protein Rab-4A-like n=1 Tax=Pteropus vampyrus TaxID=132908 RepID=A0A6P6C2N4_PTEVA|nr:ras-related protein Rab-4A-like [Pteropus vampyrus]
MSQTAMSETYDFLFKFLVIGNAGTGKSCLLHQFIEKKYSCKAVGVKAVEVALGPSRRLSCVRARDEHGSQNERKPEEAGGPVCVYPFLRSGRRLPGGVQPRRQSGPGEVAGQERFRSVTRSYYRGAAGALLVYDITSRETYNALTNWLTDARMLASQSIVVILCGNKKDLDADREVTFLEASRFAQENELMFLETSALTGESVEDAFVQCARKILNKIESGELDPERMGSGIQYGDAALRQLRSPRRAQAPSAQDCGC